jgi:hypothetical protein
MAKAELPGVQQSKRQDRSRAMIKHDITKTNIAIERLLETTTTASISADGLLTPSLSGARRKV